MKKAPFLKMLIPFLAIALFTVSCKKQSVKVQSNGMGAAPPLIYQVLDKSGQSIFTAPNDSIRITYKDEGGTEQFYDHISEMTSVPTDSLSAAEIAYMDKYNGLRVLDSYPMITISTRTIDPVNTFELNYHGTDLGSVYFKYLRWNYTNKASWEEASVFTFNNVPVKMDTTGGGHLYVIQLQQ